MGGTALAAGRDRAAEMGLVVPPNRTGSPPGAATLPRAVKRLVWGGSTEVFERAHDRQKLSALTTSPPWVLLSALQVARLIEFLTNFTEPSPKTTFTPPGCRLRAPF
jgi:hypothetical protein